MRGIDRVLAVVLLAGAVGGVTIFARESGTFPTAGNVHLLAPPRQRAADPVTIFVSPALERGGAQAPKRPTRLGPPPRIAVLDTRAALADAVRSVPVQAVGPVPVKPEPPATVPPPPAPAPSAPAPPAQALPAPAPAVAAPAPAPEPPRVLATVTVAPVATGGDNGKHDGHGKNGRDQGKHDDGPPPPPPPVAAVPPVPTADESNQGDAAPAPVDPSNPSLESTGTGDDHRRHGHGDGH